MEEKAKENCTKKEICTKRGDFIKGDVVLFWCCETPTLDKEPKQGTHAHRIQGGCLSRNVYCVLSKRKRHLKGIIKLNEARL